MTITSRPDRPEGLSGRLRRLFTTVPPLRTWALLLGGLLGLLAASWLFDRLGVVAWRPDPAFLLGLGVLLGLATALAEETFFRGILLSPARDSAGDLSAALLSAFLFALWHPLQTLLYRPVWAPHAWTWWFLAGTALLGFACARLTLATRSIWPAVVLHWLLAVGWKALYGLPSCGFAARVLCE